MDWFQKINVDPDPTSLWHPESERLLPREWGDLVHQVLAKICTADEVEKVLRPYLSDGTIDPEAADWIRYKFNQMASHPLINSAFAPTAKVKTECEILHQGKVLRLDRLAELPDIIYLLDNKTGKKDPKHKKQLNDYVSAIGD